MNPSSGHAMAEGERAQFLRWIDQAIERAQKHGSTEGIWLFASQWRTIRAILATTPPTTNDAIPAGMVLDWLTGCDNLVLANGTQHDGFWEVRRGSVKGELRGRGPTPLDALRAAMLAAAPKPSPTPKGGLPGRGEVERLAREAREFADVAQTDGFDAADALDLIREFAALAPAEAIRDDGEG